MNLELIKSVSPCLFTCATSILDTDVFWTYRCLHHARRALAPSPLSHLYLGFNTLIESVAERQPLRLNVTGLTTPSAGLANIYEVEISFSGRPPARPQMPPSPPRFPRLTERSGIGSALSVFKRRRRVGWTRWRRGDGHQWSDQQKGQNLRQ